jgi:hypothetical protein
MQLTKRSFPNLLEFLEPHWLSSITHNFGFPGSEAAQIYTVLFRKENEIKIQVSEAWDSKDISIKSPPLFMVNLCLKHNNNHFSLKTEIEKV